MTDADVLALKAYIFAQPAVPQPNRPHEIPAVYRLELGRRLWRWMHFVPGPMGRDGMQSEPWNRGAYLVEAVGHCGECHTPRDAFGGPVRERAMAGTLDAGDGVIPNITPDVATGIGSWSAGDLEFLLRTGIPPDGDAMEGAMAEVVQNVSRLRAADLEAIVFYVRSLPPVRHRPGRRRDEPDGEHAKPADEPW